MNKEEAIKRLKRRINQLRLNFAITNEDLEAIETVLNLLEKKDIYIIETKEANRQLSIELQKKDKIIDLMSLAISNYDAQLIINKYKNKEDVKIHFIENCEEYCKQYFENKVGKDKI